MLSSNPALLPYPQPQMTIALTKSLVARSRCDPEHCAQARAALPLLPATAGARLEAMRPLTSQPPWLPHKASHCNAAIPLLFIYIAPGLLLLPQEYAREEHEHHIRGYSSQTRQ